MPVCYHKESSMIMLEASYSPATIKRRFEIIDEIIIAGSTYLMIYDGNIPQAAIIRSTLKDIRGERRHPIVATLELKRYQQHKSILSVQDFWQDEEALQIEGMVVDESLREKGLASALYESLVLHKGITLMSDNKHYLGGKALWKKIARSSQKLSVFVLDNEERMFYPYDGQRMRYDGQSIPEAQIWSIHPDMRRYGTILVAGDRRKFSGQYAAISQWL